MKIEHTTVMIDKSLDEAIMNYELTTKKENIIEYLINEHWSSREKSKFLISRIRNDSSKYLFGKNNKNEGFYLVWNNNAVRDLTKDIYQDIIKEGKDFNLSTKYHIFGTGMLISRK
ncbi:TPA: hypothetical protein ACJV51_004684, partial [Salmonella enterica subsp. enterica serovar Braenderup]